MDEFREIKYHFHWSDKEAQHFTIEMDPVHSLIKKSDDEGPQWTMLEYEKCEICPLKTDDCKYCPVALNLNKLITRFSDVKSYSTLIIKVEMPERTYEKETSMQVGLQSIFGLIMATSGCPFFQFLRPMAHFHLPFSTLEETLVRSLSFYLLKQYFTAHKGGTPDCDLKGLDLSYEKLTQVNQGLAQRIGKMREDFYKESGDASPNAIIILDGFAQMLSMELQTEFASIAPIFE